MHRIARVFIFIIILLASAVFSLNISTSTDLNKQLNFIQTHDEQIAKLFNLTASMEHRLTELQKENELLKRNVTAMAETRRTLTGINTELEKELSALKQRFGSSPLAVYDIRENFSSIRNDISGLIGSLSSVQQFMTTFMDDLTYLHNEHDLLENTTVMLTESLKHSLKQSLSMLQHDNIQINDRLTKLECITQIIDSNITVLIRENVQRDIMVASLSNKVRVIRGFTVQNTQAVENVRSLQVLIFDQVNTNEGGKYNSRSGIFITDISGWYVFFFDIRVKYSNQLCSSKLIKNGDFVVLTYALSGDRYHAHSSESNMAVLHVKAGDQLWVQSSPAGEQSCAIDDHSSFSGFLLNAD